MPLWNGYQQARTGAMAAVVALGCGTAAAAQTGNLELELNTSADVPGACRLTFVATNGTGVDLTNVAYEVAVWVNSGAVETLMVLEFGALPLSNTRVIQFDLPKLGCGDLARITVNGLDTCETADGPKDLCTKSLNASSRLPTIAFGLK